MNRFTVALLTLAALTGCGDSTGPGRSPAGTYVLEAMDGQPLPFEILATTYLSGSMALKADGTFIAQTTSRFENSFTGAVETVTESGTGTWTHNGQTILFEEPGDLFPYDGTYDGSVIEIDVGSFSMRYRR